LWENIKRNWKKRRKRNLSITKKKKKHLCLVSGEYCLSSYL